MRLKNLSSKRFYLLFCFLFFISVNGFCQKGYLKGCIISPADDTISVKIKRSALVKNQCHYICSSGENCIGNSENVKAFFLSNGRAFCFEQFSHQKENISCYFEVLVKGRICLYSYQQRLFIQKDAKQLEELLNTKENVANEKGLNFIKEKKEYLGLLRFYLSDSTMNVPNFRYLRFDEDEFIKIVRTYNEGSRFLQELETKRYKPFFSVGLEAIYAMDSYKFQIHSGYCTDQFKKQYKIPGVGVIVRYQFTKHLSVYSGANLKHLDYSTYQSFGTGYPIRYYTLNNSFEIISAPIVFDYQLNKSSFKPTVGMGFMFEKSLMKNKTYLEEINDYSLIYSTEKTTTFLNRINSYFVFELGCSTTVNNLQVGLKARSITSIPLESSYINKQFYHQSGVGLVFSVMF